MKTNRKLDLSKIMPKVVEDPFKNIDAINDISQRLIEILIFLDSLQKYGYVSGEWEIRLNELLNEYSKEPIEL